LSGCQRWSRRNCGRVVYYDGQFDDARLLIHLAMTAADHGATAVELLSCNQIVA